MKVCVVGSGGREHALVNSLAKSASVVATPGNPGMDRAQVTNQVPEEIEADLYVIGPEVPLVEGLGDRLRSQGKVVFGPGSDGAKLEGSKAWMKDILARAKIPTARYQSCGNIQEAVEFLNTLKSPYVIKTDGLAAGKGVLVTESYEEALHDIEAKLSGKSFAGAGKTIVIEEFMDGYELSVMAICDGKSVFPLQAAQDYKRVGNGNQGPNTGGMGAYSPVALVDMKLVDRVVNECIEPLVYQFRQDSIDYGGFVDVGLMITEEGPKIVEFNIRFGDPETQVVLPLLTNDLATILYEAASGSLKTVPTFSVQTCVGVVLASQGYPDGPIRTGDPIIGLDTASQSSGSGVAILHAGTQVSENGQILTGGGRVLNVTALGADVNEARECAYRALGEITWPGMHFRMDIGN